MPHGVWGQDGPSCLSHPLASLQGRPVIGGHEVDALLQTFTPLAAGDVNVTGTPGSVGDRRDSLST